MTMNNFLKYIILPVVILIGIHLIINDKPISTSEIITRVDTVRITELVPDTVYQTREVVKYLTRVVTETDLDTLILRDTIPVYLPIYTYIFEDSSYRAEIEGYDVVLKSMQIYPRSTIRTNTITPQTPWFSHGVQLGFGGLYGTRGFDLGFYFGYGLMLHF